MSRRREWTAKGLRVRRVRLGVCVCSGIVRFLSSGYGIRRAMKVKEFQGKRAVLSAFPSIPDVSFVLIFSPPARRLVEGAVGLFIM